MTITCPHCKREFTPPPWMRTLAAGEDYQLECPHCGERFRGTWIVFRQVKGVG
jgi:uncharacterized Zn-finger protein